MLPLKASRKEQHSVTIFCGHNELSADAIWSEMYLMYESRCLMRLTEHVLVQETEPDVHPPTLITNKQRL